MLATLLMVGMGQAFAAGHELSFEASRIGVAGPSWDVVSADPGYASVGLRGVYGFSKNLGLVVGWQRGVDGSDVEVYSADGGLEEAEFRAGFIGNALRVGPKAQVARWRWVAPYATAQASVSVGRVSFDTDPDRDDNVGQVQDTAWSFGGFAAAGVDLKPVKVTKGLRLGAHLEAGYGLQSAYRFETNDGAADLGGFGMRGLVVSGGAGVRF
jgi:hypothetical protein